MRSLPLGICLLLFSSASCSDETTPEPEPEPSLTPVSSELPIVDSVETCQPLSSGERLVSVSPEGQAWLASAVDGGLRLRVLDLFSGELVETTQELPISNLSQLRSWSANEASLIADGHFYELSEAGRFDLTPPAGLVEGASFCGSLGSNGFVLADGKLSELRADGQWWSFSAASEGTFAELVAAEGECLTRDNALWLTSAAGELLEVTPTHFTTLKNFVELREAAILDASVLAIDARGLWVGPGEWSGFSFGAEAPERLVAAGGFAFLKVGGRLLRFDGTNFAEMASELGTPNTLQPYAGGLWLADEATLCHHSFGASARIQGLRPNQRLLEDDSELSLAASPDQTMPKLSVDGVETALSTDAETGVASATIAWTSVGWHELTVDSESGERLRTLWVKRVPEIERSFAKDVFPLYEATCANSGCHGGADPKGSDLSTFEAWQAKAAQIRTRVVDTRTMPPAANTPASWNDEQIDVIAQWLEGGMLP